MRLAPCPKTPNCVSTEAPAGDPHHMDPIPYQGGREAARQRLLAVLGRLERTRIVESTPDSIRAECRSRIFRFVDDVELLLDDAAKVIRFRSAARVGVGDHGVNRARMKRSGREFLAAK